MKNIALALIIGFSTLATGCSYQAGTQISQSAASKFVIGSTSKAEILSALGTPQKMTNDGKDTWLTYTYTEINSFSANKDNSTTFVIDESGKLKSILKGGAGAGNSGNALLSAAGL